VLTAIALGWLVGIRRAFDPDCGIAAPNIAARRRNPWKMSCIGVRWGIEHGLRPRAVGFAMIFEFALGQGNALAG